MFRRFQKIFVYIFVKLKFMRASGSFDWGEHDNKPNPNMEDILDKVDKFSIDWDNFDVPNNDNQDPASLSNSNIFNQSKKSDSRKSEPRELEDSRDLMEISMAASQYQNRSFRFEKQDHRIIPNENQRYTRLQKLLSTAKKDSLEHFYKNIQRESKAYNDEPEKFANYKDFKEHIKQLKAEKRQQQLATSSRDVTNPFSSINSNRLSGNFSTNKPEKIGQSNKYQPSEKSSQNNQPNFTKKAPQTAKPFSSSNLLPKEFESENFFEIHKNKQPSRLTAAQKYNNFYEGEKLPEIAAQHNKDEDAFEFFQSESKKKQQKIQKQDKVVLEPIRQQKHNSFQKTFEQQKLDNLFKNYQVMRKDFEQLMGELKSTNEGQEKLVTELRKLKQQKLENDVKEERREKKQKKQRQIIEKNKKLDSIKDQITKIKTADKDILFSQINKKIENLQAVVRSALQQIKEEKDAKIVPKVINYFCDHEKNFQNIDKQFQKGFQQFDPEAYQQKKDVQEFFKAHDHSRELFTQNIQNLQVNSRKIINPNTSTPKMMIESKKSQKKSSPQSRSQHSRQASLVGSKIRQDRNNLFSPLDLHLQANASGQFDFSMAEEQFVCEDFSEQFFPRQFQSSNKNLRNIFIQKSSVVFESFDFHVSGRFSVVEDQIHPIVAAIRIGNKCSIDLYDVHAIIYGPHGPGVSTDPSTIFQQQVKKNSSFSFQVSLDKSCLEDNGFSIQISYKTDSMNKKKINFKVPLPLVQLIRPEFIYEQKFINQWDGLSNQMFIRPKRLDSNYFRSHEDLKLILPFIEITQQNPDCFSYGIMFRYPKSQNTFYLKVTCYVSGRSSLKLRTERQGDTKLKQQIMNVFNFILFSPY